MSYSQIVNVKFESKKLIHYQIIISSQTLIDAGVNLIGDPLIFIRLEDAVGNINYKYYQHVALRFSSKKKQNDLVQGLTQ